MSLESGDVYVLPSQSRPLQHTLDPKIRVNVGSLQLLMDFPLAFFGWGKGEFVLSKDIPGVQYRSQVT